MPPTLTQAVGAVFIAWLSWKFLKQISRKHLLDNIPGPLSTSFLKGNLPDLINPRAWDYHREAAERYGGVFRIKAFFGENLLYAFDPKALQHIIVKDQDIYEESNAFIIFNEVVFGKGLIATIGGHHRKQRKMLNPAFSTAHMREMVPTFYAVVNKVHLLPFGNSFQCMVKNGPETIDIYAWMTRASLELIGQSGLGYSFDPLAENGPEHPFAKSAKLLVPAMDKLLLPRILVLPLVAHIGSPQFRRRVIDFLSWFWKDLRRARDIADVIADTSIEIFESKKRALHEGDEAVETQIGGGKDIISILLKANAVASQSDKLPDSELAHIWCYGYNTQSDKLPDSEVLGQISSLTFGAMDTTSNALSRIFHLLSEHSYVQERLRDEIREAQKEHGELQYDELVNLPYLDAVCRETMRLYPPAQMVLREAGRDVMLPVSEPITGTDGTVRDELFVPKGTKILVSLLASNRNSRLWGPDSYEWKPERWLSPLPAVLVDAKIPGVYSNLMTFLGGGRACIGFKFSELEMKVMLAVLVPNFQFTSIHKNVFWQMSGIAQPTLGEGDSFEPQLPLKVTAYDR